MTIQMGNIWYFGFILLCAGITVGLYFLLRHKSPKTIKIVLLSMLVFNFVLHFTKGLYEPYKSDPYNLASGLWFINLCATSVLFFPLIFISKNDTWRDYMIYMGILAGAATMIYPEGVLGREVFVFETWRFYICHMLLFVVSCLMLVLGVHKLDYRRIIRIPFCALAMFLFIMVNCVLMSELGFTQVRGDNFFEINYNNQSLVWGPERVGGDFLKVFTPDFMKYVPFGEHAGELKYWPFFWLVVPTFVYGIVGCLLLCLPFEHKHIKQDWLAFREKIRQKKQ